MTPRSLLGTLEGGGPPSQKYRGSLGSTPSVFISFRGKPLKIFSLPMHPPLSSVVFLCGINFSCLPSDVLSLPSKISVYGAEESKELVDVLSLPSKGLVYDAGESKGLVVCNGTVASLNEVDGILVSVSSVEVLDPLSASSAVSFSVFSSAKDRAIAIEISSGSENDVSEIDVSASKLYSFF